MDGMTVLCKTVVQPRWAVEDLDGIITWARMKLTPAQSRSVVLKQVKVTNHLMFKVKDIVIPTLTDNPVKSLGKSYRTELNDKQSFHDTHKEGSKLLMEVDCLDDTKHG